MKKFDEFINENVSKQEKEFIKYAKALLFAVKKKYKHDLVEKYINFDPDNKGKGPRVILAFEIKDSNISFEEMSEWNSGKVFFKEFDDIRSKIDELVEVLHSFNMTKLLFRKKDNSIEMGYALNEKYIIDNEEMLKSYTGIRKYKLFNVKV